MTAPQEFMRLVNTTNLVALDQACMRITQRGGMFAAKACALSSLSIQLFRAMRETHDFIKALEELDACLQIAQNL